MPKRHRVRAGEGISSIAYEHGLFPDAVWKHPENAALRATREDPDILLEGDEVFVPDRQARAASAPTDQRTVFRQKNTPAILRLQVVVDGALRAGCTYELEVDGAARSGVTDGDGVLQVFVPPTARVAVLRIAPDDAEFVVHIGHLCPLATIEGVQTRLNNLGFACGPADGRESPATEAAIRAFQRAVGLAESGDWRDPATTERLAQLHDTRTAPPAGPHE